MCRLQGRPKGRGCGRPMGVCIGLRGPPPLLQRTFFWAVPGTAHPPVEGGDTWPRDLAELATQGCRATPSPYLPTHSHQDIPQWAARNGERPFKRYGSPTRYWADRYSAYSLRRHKGWPEGAEPVFPPRGFGSLPPPPPQEWRVRESQSHSLEPSLSLKCRS